MFLTTLKNNLVDVLFPPLCLGCQKHLEVRDKFVCDGCLSLIKLNNTLFCPVCQARLPENKRICNHGSEKSKKSPFLLAAASSYDNKIIREIIHNYKYKGFGKLSPVLGNILIDYLKISRLQITNYIITYVPLYFSREKKRGFNQAKLLAEIIAKNFNLEMVNVLKRIKDNPPQAKTKNYDERTKNISGAFQITEPEKIKNRNVLLIDDVYTSGATMSEAARILKQNGAKKIVALTVAKT
ncbi:ComF family protein [Candidatus Wolfebacteria bacterium]|nr:ComF family protein [Candidatus Wolfebacteria bacterium]